MTARDPAAAEIVAALYQAWHRHHDLRLTILAEAPATDKLFTLDIPFTPWRPHLPHKKALLTRLTEQLERQLGKPPVDILLTGLSGPGWGIDEIAQWWGCQKGLPTTAIQTWWGDVNQPFGELPITYFVRDHFAARLTRRRAPRAHAIVLNPWPFHQRPVLSDTSGWRRGEEACIVFYVQPIRTDVQIRVIRVLAKHGRKVCVKLHPKSDRLQRIRMQSLRGSHLQITDSIPPCLWQTSIFSSILEQLLYSPARKAPPSLIFTLTTPLARFILQKNTGLRRLPYAKPFFHTASSTSQLHQLLKKRTPVSFRQRLRRLALTEKHAADHLLKALIRMSRAKAP